MFHVKFERYYATYGMWPRRDDAKESAERSRVDIVGPIHLRRSYLEYGVLSILPLFWNK
jgi:hypothetical protein